MWKKNIRLIMVVLLMMFDIQALSTAAVDDATEDDSNASASSSEKKSQIPDHFEVRQNYPNPFNAITTIEYDLSEGAGVYAVIYNILGHQIKTLKNDLEEAGRHKLQWDGTTNSGLESASGVYFYVLLSDHNYSIGKMLLLK